jgi:hypothetical protein
MKSIIFTGGVFVRVATSAVFVGVLGFTCLSRNASAGIGPDAGNTVSRQPNTSSIGPDSLPSPDLLGNITLSAGRLYDSLISFVCREDIERFKGNVHNPQGHKVDVITSTVSYGTDAEHYSDIFRNNKPLDRISGLSGAWSEGEYGTLLGDTLKALKSRNVRFVSYSSFDEAPAAVYGFEYSTDDSPWEIAVAGRHYFLPFHGQIWASPATGDVLRIVRVAEGVPSQTGILGVNWAVEFGPQTADGKTFWLPARAVYSVSYPDAGRHEWNLIAFSGYRRYGSEVIVHFQ